MDKDFLKIKLELYSYVTARILINVITIIALFYALELKLAIVLTLLNVLLLPFTIKKVYTLKRALKTSL